MYTYACAYIRCDSRTTSRAKIDEYYQPTNECLAKVFLHMCMCVGILWLIRGKIVRVGVCVRACTCAYMLSRIFWYETQNLYVPVFTCFSHIPICIYACIYKYCHTICYETQVMYMYLYICKYLYTCMYTYILLHNVS